MVVPAVAKSSRKHRHNRHCDVFVVFFVSAIAFGGGWIAIKFLGRDSSTLPSPSSQVGIKSDSSSVIDEENINLNVWERGAGITRACGSAACATAVAASRLNLTKREVNILLPGGSLGINWKKDNQIVMTGPYEFNSEDIIDISNYK